MPCMCLHPKICEIVSFSLHRTTELNIHYVYASLRTGESPRLPVKTASLRRNHTSREELCMVCIDLYNTLQKIILSGMPGLDLSRRNKWNSEGDNVNTREESRTLILRTHVRRGGETGLSKHEKPCEMSRNNDWKGYRASRRPGNGTRACRRPHNTLIERNDRLGTMHHVYKEWRWSIY